MNETTIMDASGMAVFAIDPSTGQWFSAPYKQPSLYQVPASFGETREKMSRDNLLSLDILNKLSDVMENDTVYIKCPDINSLTISPIGTFFTIQVHNCSNDWENSITVYDFPFNLSSIDIHRNIIKLLATFITLSGRDVVVNNEKFLLK